MEREEGFEDGILPQIHISGCPSSCGTHQTGVIGFRGGVKSVNKEVKPAFNLFVKGCCFQGKERMGEELGAILEENIPAFLKALGHAVQESGLDLKAGMQRMRKESARLQRTSWHKRALFKRSFLLSGSVV